MKLLNKKLATTKIPFVAINKPELNQVKGGRVMVEIIGVDT